MPPPSTCPTEPKTPVPESSSLLSCLSTPTNCPGSFPGTTTVSPSHPDLVHLQLPTIPEPEEVEDQSLIDEQQEDSQIGNQQQPENSDSDGDKPPFFPDTFPVQRYRACSYPPLTSHPPTSDSTNHYRSIFNTIVPNPSIPKHNKTFCHKRSPYRLY
ncbi:hypothetical protein EI94DRAFT_1803012 [Lactarius quietus]|nr:hypothetical protein EI94DRAFT_1803012 [Lactarius quietus]